MNILIDLYRKTLNSLGLVVTDDGYIKISKDGGYLIKSEKEPLPLVLPTKQQIKTLLREENGKVELSKLPFNPLDESAIKGESVSIRKMKTIIQHRLNQGVYVAGLLLLKLAMDENVLKSPSMLLVNFLSRLTKLRKPNVKKLVDSSVVNAFDKINKRSKEVNIANIKTYLKKNATYNGIKYYRLFTIKSEVYDELRNGDIGIKLRNKDTTAAMIVYEYLLDLEETSSSISFGSNDKIAPAYQAMMMGYLTIMNKIMTVVKELSFLDEELADSLDFDLEVSITDIENLELYKPYILEIPTIADIEAQVHNKQAQQQVIASATPVPTSNTTQLQSQQVAEVNDSDPTRSVIDAILHKNPQAIPPQPQPVYSQQQVMGQPAMYPQQQQQVNTAYQQPLYGQPAGYPQPQMGYQQPVQQQVRPVGINGAMAQAQQMARPMYGQPAYQPQPQPQMGYQQGYQPMQQQGYGYQPQVRPMGVNGMMMR